MTDSDPSDTVDVHIETQGGEVVKSLKPGDRLSRSNITVYPRNAVPVEALEELVQEWRQREQMALDNGLNGNAIGNADCADELQALINDYE